MALRNKIKAKLLKQYFVRFHMSLILGATIASGVLIDKGLLYFGFDAMGWRYALSVLGAYGVFFGLVRLWVWYAAGVAPRVGDVDFDPGDLTLGRGGEPPPVAFSGFHGGDAGGGGASDLFDAPVGGGIDLNVDLDLDEGFWILLVLAVLVLVICLAGGYLIWMAPEILPEVAIEAAIGAGLLRQVKTDSAGWAARLLWKTWIPLACVMGIAFFAGAFMQSACPDAKTARGALYCASQR
ncbi:MAG: hypothetical protein FJW32_05835 [Acidobacteria bacterium]|nr:hypothetical protein [Acidobacteriota bacterium]